MSTDFELFPGKNLSGLFKDIYQNQVNKKEKISSMIDEFKKMVRHAGDVAVMGPIIKDLIDSSVKNDDHLIKLATIAQRIVAADKKSEGEAGFLSAEERAQLLAEIDQVQEEVKRMDDIENEVEELKQKISK
jgi:HPt (histidine-containing phosphotransfer) domain-containing protein